MENKMTRLLGILVSVVMVLTMLIIPGKPAFAATDGVEATFALNINILGSSGRIFKDSDTLPFMDSSETASYIGNFTAGTSIILKAVGGNQRSIFKGWSGDATSTNETITLVMDSDKTVAATFGTYLWVGTAINGFWWEDLPLVERIAKLEAGIAEIKFNMAGMQAFGYHGSQMFETNMLGQFEGRLKVLVAELALVNGSSGETTNINASVTDSGGAISPTGVVTVNPSTNQTFMIAATPGNHVSDVLVDGVSQGAITTYTFTNVSASHTISASFAADAPSGGSGIGDGGGGSTGGGGGGGGGGVSTTPIYTPAAFTISKLAVTPASIEAGKDVSVTFSVTNSGDLSGVYSADLMVGGTTEATKDVTVEGGESEQVSFIVKRDQAGDYTLSIGALTGSFTLLEPIRTNSVEAKTEITATPETTTPTQVTTGATAATETSTSVQTATDSATVAAETTTPVPKQTASASAAALTTSVPFNPWWILLGAGIVLVVVILLLGIKRSKRYNR